MSVIWTTKSALSQSVSGGTQLPVALLRDILEPQVSVWSLPMLNMLKMNQVIWNSSLLNFDAFMQYECCSD